MSISWQSRKLHVIPFVPHSCKSRGTNPSRLNAVIHKDAPWLLLPLAPLMLLQAIAVKRRAQRLPPARGCEGRCGEGSVLWRLVGLGDSTIAGIGVTDHTQSVVGRTAAQMHAARGETIEWQARGFSGLKLQDVCTRLAPSAPPAEIYLVSAGVNDAVAGTAPEAFANDLQALAARLRERAPGCRIVFAGIPPLASFPALPWPLSAYLDRRGRALQAAARSVAVRANEIACHDFPARLEAGDFASDGFHPGPSGCDAWARELVTLLT